MPKTQRIQAPKLIHRGNKFVEGNTLKGKAIRTHYLEQALAQMTTSHEFGIYKVMMFLTGNADEGNFYISEQTITTRCNISSSGYQKIRKTLIDRGWISHEKSIYIRVNYDVIFKQYERFQKGEDLNHIINTPFKDVTNSEELTSHLKNQSITGSTPEESITGSTPEESITGSTPEEGITGSTPEEGITGSMSDKIDLNEKNQSIIGSTPQTITRFTPQGITQSRYNNIIIYYKSKYENERHQLSDVIKETIKTLCEQNKTEEEIIQRIDSIVIQDYTMRCF